MPPTATDYCGSPSCRPALLRRDSQKLRSSWPRISADPDSSRHCSADRATRPAHGDNVPAPHFLSRNIRDSFARDIDWHGRRLRLTRRVQQRNKQIGAHRPMIPNGCGLVSPAPHHEVRVAGFPVAATRQLHRAGSDGSDAKSTLETWSLTPRTVRLATGADETSNVSCRRKPEAHV